MFWWQATRRRIDGLVMNLQLVTAVNQRTGPIFDIGVGDAMALDTAGRRMTGPFTLAVCAAPSRDGQEVRRSMEVVYTLVGQAALAAGLVPQDDHGPDTSGPQTLDDVVAYGLEIFDRNWLAARASCPKLYGDGRPFAPDGVGSDLRNAFREVTRNTMIDTDIDGPGIFWPVSSWVAWSPRSHRWRS